MPERCANPACDVLFSLREGQLFQFEIRSTILACTEADRDTECDRPVREVAHYWLCGACSAVMTLALRPEVGIEIQDLRCTDGSGVRPDS